MFDIGWSELLVIGIVALVVIGPKELPGVLRSVGFWIGKARRMAGEFQSQFQEAMREAEVADLKKEFDELASGNVLTSTVKDVEEAMKLDTSAIMTPTTPEPPTPETLKEATLHQATTGPATAELPPPTEPVPETPQTPTALQPVDKAS
ncbi:MAG: Sec-independent protein translocase protein TatB [Xanthobacteraceae bacterium]